MKLPRLTVRVRLTLLYTALFTVFGAAVIGITYLLVARLPRTRAIVIERDGARGSSVDELLAKCELGRQQGDPLPPYCEQLYQQGVKAGAAGVLTNLLQYSVVTLAASTLLAAFVGWFVAGRVLRPVHRITATARAASQHHLSARVALDGPRDELRELADTFDAMLGRLQGAFESQRRFIANAGHELRTPLTVMRTTLDVVLAKPAPTADELVGMGQDVRVAVDHAERLINALLTLARNERGLTVREPVDLATVVEDVLDTAPACDRRVHLALQPAAASGDPVLLERLVANLVDNAVRYNAAGGDVWLMTSTVDGRATLAVANTGPVIAPDALRLLFEPFQRLQDRTGSDGFGLGLAIVASIAAVHHGTVAAQPRPDGGLTVTVALPARAGTRTPPPGPDPGHRSSPAAG